MHCLSLKNVLTLLTAPLTLAFPTTSIARRAIGNTPISSIQSREAKPEPGFTGRVHPADTASASYEDVGGIGVAQGLRAADDLLYFAGVIALSDDKWNVLLVKDGNTWVLPEKLLGGGDPGHASAVDSAQTILEDLATVSIEKSLSAHESHGMSTQYFQMQLSRTPSQSELGHTRKWATFQEAARYLQRYRPDQYEGLMDSDIQGKPPPPVPFHRG